MMAPPFVQEIFPVPQISTALRALQNWPQPALLDSAQIRDPLGRYSFLSAGPSRTVVIREPKHGDFPFEELRSLLPDSPVAAVEGLPPFQGGIIGLCSYELGGCFEQLPRPMRDDLQIPAAVIGRYDWTIAWDHVQGRCWFIGQGPEAREQWGRVREALSSTPAPISIAAPRIPEGHPLLGHSGVVSNFTPEQYLEAVARVIEYIRAGDIFQANLSQQLRAPAALSPVEMFLRLRENNPAPFAGYFAAEDWAVLSSSPERFLQVRGDLVSTRPIKGTRRRSPVPEADLFLRDELRESSKDQAENVMIVDLLRNDLSRVCRPHSISVPQLCEVETYETVTHLVSEVQGRLRPGTDFWDLLAAAFPGGSITGAPKIRAMEIITELEQVARGPYCGTLFYVSDTGAADSNILIRTMTQRNGLLVFPAGGGIVADSNPVSEYLETLHKAEGMLRAVTPAR